jgi:hypothetical protein
MSPHLAAFYDPQEVINRRFGPAFEKPCRIPQTIICAIKRCQIADRCQLGSAQRAGK